MAAFKIVPKNKRLLKSSLVRKYFDAVQKEMEKIITPDVVSAFASGTPVYVTINGKIVLLDPRDFYKNGGA